MMSDKELDKKFERMSRECAEEMSCVKKPTKKKTMTTKKVVKKTKRK